MQHLFSSERKLNPGVYIHVQQSVTFQATKKSSCCTPVLLTQSQTSSRREVVESSINITSNMRLVGRKTQQCFVCVRPFLNPNVILTYRRYGYRVVRETHESGAKGYLYVVKNPCKIVV